VLSESKLKDYN